MTTFCDVGTGQPVPIDWGYAEPDYLLVRGHVSFDDAWAALAASEVDRTAREHYAASHEHARIREGVVFFQKRGRGNTPVTVFRRKWFRPGDVWDSGSLHLMVHCVLPNQSAIIVPVERVGRGQTVWRTTDKKPRVCTHRPEHWKLVN